MTTTAEALFRVKTQHPEWRIVRVDGPNWQGFAAFRGIAGDPDEEVITDLTVAGLELQLAGK